MLGVFSFIFLLLQLPAHAGQTNPPSEVQCNQTFEARLQAKIETLKTLASGQAINLIGGPGAGKGTLAAMLTGMEHISIGQLFRDEFDAGTEDGIAAKDYMSQGVLVPADIYDRVVGRHLAKIDLSKVLVLDGSTRNMENKGMIERMLGAHGVRIAVVVFLNVSEPILIERALARRTCSNGKCNTVYNILKDPVGPNETCPKCQSPLFKRDDDNPESIQGRLKTFREETKPVIEQFRSEGKLIQVDVSGQDTPEQVAERAIDAMIAFLSKPSPF